MSRPRAQSRRAVPRGPSRHHGEFGAEATFTQDAKALEKAAKDAAAKPIGFFEGLWHKVASIFGGEIEPTYPRAQGPGYAWGGDDQLEPDMSGEGRAASFYMKGASDFPYAPIIGAEGGADGVKYSTRIKG